MSSDGGPIGERGAAARAGPRERLRRFTRAPLGDIEFAETTNLVRDVPLYGPMIVGLLLLAAIIVWPHVPHGFVVAFVVLLALEAAFKAAGTVAFTRGAPFPPRSPLWRLFICGGAAYAGVLYGLASLVLLLPLPLEALLPLVCIAAALAALAIWGIPHHWRANLLFSIPLIAPLVIALLLRGEGRSTALALLITAIVAMGLRVSRGVSVRLSALIVTNAENEVLRAKAERAVIDKSRFMAAASHDLRQPLHALGLFQHALRSRSDDPADTRLIDSIGRTSAQLRALLDALLDISSLDARAIEPRFEDVSLAALFRMIEDEFSGQADGKGLALRVVSTDAVVRTDPLLLARVLGNLMSNAIKFSDRGTVTLAASHVVGTDVVTIRVEDDGPGIAESERRHVFTEFYRVESAASSQAGVGLGLSIVSRLCALLGVELALDTGGTDASAGASADASAGTSAGGGDGAGTRVELRVPAGDPAEVTSAVLNATERRLDGMHVLVIDDDATTLAGLSATLESWGCTVRATATVGEAVRPLHPGAAAPELLLYDARVTARTGERGPDDLVATVRTRLERRVPAIVIGWNAKVAGSRAPPVAVEHLVKPVAPGELRRAVERLVPVG